MSPTRLRECIALPGWSQRELSRLIGLGDRAVGKMSTGKHAIPPELEDWLEAMAAIWSGLTPYQVDAARNMRCDQGRFIRFPRGFPLTDEEADRLQAVAAFHMARPHPESWKSDYAAALQGSAAEG